MRIHNSCNISCRNCTFSTLYYFWHMFLYLASTETFQQVGTIANGSYNKNRHRDTVEIVVQTKRIKYGIQNRWKPHAAAHYPTF